MLSSDAMAGPVGELPLRFSAGDEVLGRFVLMSELSALAWTAWEGEREVVLSFIPPALWLEPGLRADLEREVAKNQRLTHPALRKIEGIAVSPDEEVAALVMERLSGRSLADLFKDEGSLPKDRVTDWVQTLCAALEEAHEKEGLISRELEPAHVWITDEGALRLEPLGIRPLLRAFASDEVKPNPAFASPQQLNGEAPTVADDLYSLGALIEWMGGAKTETGQHEAIAACLRLKKAERPASVRELRERLGIAQPREISEPAIEPEPEVAITEAIIPSETVKTEPESAEPLVSPPPSSQERAPEKAQRSLAIPVLTLLLLSAGGAAGWWFGVEQPKRDAAYQERFATEAARLEAVQKEAGEVRAELERIAQEKASAEAGIKEAKAEAQEAHEARAKAEEAAAAAFRAAAEEKAERADRLFREAEALQEEDRQPERDARLFLLFREASELGHPEAAAHLGGLYLDGRGTERDPEEARRLLEKSAKRSGYAQWRLGTIYEQGLGVEKDREQAIAYYRKAADQGQPGALHRLAESQLDSDNPEKATEAMQWMTEAAQAGYAEAQSRLGVIYGTGAGVADQSEAEAFRWLELAEAQRWDVADDYAVVAAWLHMEHGMDESALRWYRKAAERGDASAQMELANHFLATPLTPETLEEARRWLTMAAAKGDEKAQTLLGTLPETAPEPATVPEAAPATEEAESPSAPTEEVTTP